MRASQKPPTTKDDLFTLKTFLMQAIYKPNHENSTFLKKNIYELIMLEIHLLFVPVISSEVCSMSPDQER